MRFILLLGSLLLSVACSRLHDGLHQQILRCGIAAEAGDRLVEITEASGFEARLVRGGEIRSPTLSPKGCVILKPADQEFSLLVRGRDDQQRGLIAAVGKFPPGLSTLPLESNSSLVQTATSAHCVAKELHLNGNFPFAFSQSAESRIQYPLVEIRVYDAEKLLRTEVQPVTPKLTLPLTLPSGAYRFELINFDAFADQRPAGEECSVVVDRTAPSVSLQLATKEPYRQGSPILRVAPGQRLKFKIDDRDTAQTYVCMTQREQEDIFVPTCSETSYTLVTDGLAVPDSGVWDLTYFARDKSGNDSALSYAALAVFHQDLIGQIQLLNSQIAELQKNADDFRAFKTFQKLLQAARSLVLREELRDVYWSLLGRFSSIANNSHLLWQTPIASYGPNLQAARSPDAEHSAFLFKNHLLIVDGGVSKTIDETYTNIAYLDAKTMAAFRNNSWQPDAAFDIYRGLEKVDTIKLADRLDIRMASDYQKKILFFVNDKARLTIYSDFKNFALFQSIKFHKPFGMNSRTPQGLPTLIPFKWPANLEFISSPDDEYTFIALQNNLVRLSTRTWTWDVKTETDKCLFKKIVVASPEEIYYLSTTTDSPWPSSCGLRRTSWNLELKPTILSTDVADIATGPGTRLPFLAAYTVEAQSIDIYSFGETPTVESPQTPRTIFIYGHPLESWSIDIDPTQPNYVFGTDGHNISRLDLEVGMNHPELAFNTFPISPKAEAKNASMILLAGAQQVLSMDDSLMKRFRVTTDSASLFPDGVVCGTDMCQGFPAQNQILGYDSMTRTLRAIHTRTRETLSYKTDRDITAFTMCGPDRVCMLADTTLLEWNLVTDEKTNRGRLSHFSGAPRLTYFSKAQMLAIVDPFDTWGRTYLVPDGQIIQTMTAAVPGIALPYPESKLVPVIGSKVLNSSLFEVDFYKHDGSLAKTISLKEPTEPPAANAQFRWDSRRVWISAKDAMIFIARPEKIIRLDPETLVENVIPAPANFEFWRMKNDDIAVLGAADSWPGDNQAWVYLFDMKTAAVQRVPRLQYLDETFAGAYKWERKDFFMGIRMDPNILTDRLGDSFKVDFTALTAVGDEFDLMVRYKVGQMLMVGPLQVNPAELESLLQKWPLANIPETDTPIEAPTL